MPDGCYRASKVFSLFHHPVALSCPAPPWIPVEDGFPLKACGNDRRGTWREGQEGRREGRTRKREGQEGRRREGRKGRSLSVMPGIHAKSRLALKSRAWRGLAWDWSSAIQDKNQHFFGIYAQNDVLQRGLNAGTFKKLEKTEFPY